MCAVAPAALALMAVSTAMTAYGMYSQGQQQKAMGEYQSAVAKNNAITAENNAQIQERGAADAEARGRIEEQQHRLKVKGLIGSQRSALAASGVQVDTGSALDVVSDSAMFGEMDALTIRSNAEREAYGMRVGAYNSRAQGANFIAEGNMAQLAGSNAARNGMWGAGASLLSGAGQIGMGYARLNPGSAAPKATGGGGTMPKYG
jgi:hypothetical protein